MGAIHRSRLIDIVDDLTKNGPTVLDDLVERHRRDWEKKTSVVDRVLRALHAGLITIDEDGTIRANHPEETP